MADQGSKIKDAENSGQQEAMSSTSTAKKGNRRATDLETSTVSSGPPPVTNCEPVPGSSSAASTSMASAATPRVIPPRFPIRVGITWQKGEKLEAMDFSHTWYPSKIVDIDEEAKYVLIHFEGWNQRYDEWVPMDSDKLRPVTRHSDRKDKGIKKRRIHPHPIYRAGDKVLAKWTDCKKYPAKISRLMEDGMYEVIFYDGVTRHIQPINIQPMPEEMSHLRTVPVEVPPAPKAKLSFKQIKVSLPESVRRVKDKVNKVVVTSDKMVCEKNKLPDKNKEHVDMDDSLGRISPCGVVLDRIRLSSRGRIIRRRKFQPKKSTSSSGRGRPVGSLDRKNKKLAYSWRIPAFKKLSAERKSVFVAPARTIQSPSSVLDSTTTTMTTDPSSVLPVTTPPIDTPATKSLPVTVTDLSRLPQFESTAVAATDNMAANTTACSRPVETHLMGPKRTKKRSHTMPHLHARRKKRSKSKDDAAKFRGLIKGRPKLSQLDRAKSLDTATVVGPPATIPLPLPVFVPSKAFIVEVDHNPFKCPHQGCNKAFRKENLLTYHIKYYHTQSEPSLACETTGGVTSPLLQSPIGTPGIRRRRKKTSSICSTDSDVSVSSKGKSSCKRYRDSEFSSLAAATSPDVLGRDLWTDGKQPHLSHHSATEEFVAVDTEDEDMEADVVNCVCGLRETSGLMIQCDVCMCWQHFVCVDNDNSGVPPTNYVCRMCESTPGIRDSCRYMYDMGWERRGELPSFPFVSDSSMEHLKTIACECNEMISAIQAIKAALHSTRRQIKISKEDADPEFQLWQTDWDNWTKPEEDLTLTPRSGDPDPSPTPSTFLFSAAPCPDITSATTEVCSPSILVSSSDPLLQSMLHVTATLTEAASILDSPPVMSQPSTTEASTSAVTPPAVGSHTDMLSSASSNPAPLITPSSSSYAGHSNTLPSFQAQTGGLVQDLFSGCHGDDPQSSSAHRIQGMDCRAESSVKKETEKLSPVDDKTQSDGGVNNTVLLQLDSERFPEPPSSGLQPASAGTSSADPAVCNGVCLDVKTNGQDLSLETVSSCAPVSPGEGAAERHGPLSLSLLVGGDSQDQLASSSLSARLDRTVEMNDSTHVTSLYLDPQGEGDDDDDDVPDNDTDTAEESLDPYRNCEQNLLIHVSRVHSDIEKQLELLEQQITDLETSEHSNPTVHLTEDNVLNDVPALKKSLSKLCRNLASVERLCVHH